MLFFYLKLIEHFKLIESSPYQLNPLDSSEHIVLQTIMSTINYYFIHMWLVI